MEAHDPSPITMSSSHLKQILGAAVVNKGSDLHLKVGKPPSIRVDGELCDLNIASLEREDMEKIVRWLCGVAKMPEPDDTTKQIDFTFQIPDMGRFRCHIYSQLRSWAAALRIIPESIPTPKSLRLPAVVNQIAQLERGIVLVSGATGMGKSTTVASILAEISKKRRCHMVTIEDPVEFIIPDGRATVSQRGVGIDVDSFEDALEASFREDPDILFIGEMRSAHSVEVALQAGESGHLCISTIHTSDVRRTIARIATMVPDEQRNAILGRLAASLEVVISQRLLPMEGRSGRILAAEVMVNGPTMKEAIRNADQHRKITGLIAKHSTGTNNNTFDQHLTWLVRNRFISLETAKSAASNPSDLVRSMNLM